jgi:hypothetical protein
VKGRLHQPAGFNADDVYERADDDRLLSDRRASPHPRRDLQDLLALVRREVIEAGLHGHYRIPFAGES